MVLTYVSSQFLLSPWKGIATMDSAKAGNEKNTTVLCWALGIWPCYPTSMLLCILC